MNQCSVAFVFILSLSKCLEIQWKKKHSIRKHYFTLFGHIVAGSSQLHTVASKVEIKTRLKTTLKMLSDDGVLIEAEAFCLTTTQFDASM